MSEATEELFLEDNLRVKDHLKEIIQQHGFANYSIKFTSGSKKGDNYVGIMYRVVVDGTAEDGTRKQLHLMCKMPPENAARRKQFKVQLAFEREVLFYNALLPAYMELQSQNGVVEDGFKEFARCLKASDEDMQECLIMEDLKHHGFDMFDRFQRIDLAHTELVMKSLAKVHALGFALKDQKPEILEPFSKLPDVFFCRPLDHHFGALLGHMIGQAAEVLGEGDEKYSQVMQKLQDNFTEIMYGCIEGAGAEPYAIMTHGDCWNNNMMFKYVDGEATDIRLLDWQICRYSSPVLDLVYYLFSCTDKAFRDQHYENLLRLYHRHFSVFLTRLGGDPNLLFPYSALQDQLKKFGVFGLLMAVMIVKIILTSPDVVPNIDEMAEKLQTDAEAIKSFSVKDERSEAKFRSRIIGVIKDVVDLGYCDSL